MADKCHSASVQTRRLSKSQCKLRTSGDDDVPVQVPLLKQMHHPGGDADGGRSCVCWREGVGGRMGILCICLSMLL